MSWAMSFTCPYTARVKLNMKCPVCNEVNLVMSERQGIEIDYCPQCRGVWLDRGELDKIIERAMASATATAPSRGTAQAPYRDYPERRKDEDEDRYRSKKRRGFLGDLFDFD
jgi:Zn-finger nucleic acid-binding protein